MLIKILTICLFVVCGCANQYERAVIKPSPVRNEERWKALAPFIKKRFQTDMTVEEIAAELAYQEYLLFSKPQNEVSKNQRN